MVIKVISFYRNIAINFKAGVVTLLSEHGVRAEFQSAFGLVLMFFWMCFLNTEPTRYTHMVDTVISHHVLGVILLLIGVFQTVTNLFYYPKARIQAAFIACLAWSSLAIIGYLAAPEFLVVPLATTFAVVQALVFTHLELHPNLASIKVG